MDIFEDAVLRYIAADCSTFVIPQYDIQQAESEQSWASFDFIGLHHQPNRIYIIEVTSASASEKLFKKIKEMFQPGMHRDRLSQQLRKDYGDKYSAWPIHVAAFVRQAEKER
ncbi:MAG TPA: hypothetical protein VIH88_00765 [Candidatus Acidoferrales bacterium]